MNNLFCHIGRTLTLTVHEFDEIAKAARDRMAVKEEAALKDRAEDIVEHYDAGL